MNSLAFSPALPLDFSEFPAAAPTDPRLAHDIGREHARYGLTPPTELLWRHLALRQGWSVGRATFAGRTLAASARVRQWLRLRLQAWQDGQALDLLQITPHYLGQLEAPRCPVTRGLIGAALPSPLRAAAGYKAGNLVVLSEQAQSAKAALEARAEQPGAGPLSAAAWARLATLLSFVTPLPHAEAARLPLRVLPPNRLHLCNPIQGVQAWITLALATSGWSERLLALAHELPSAPQRTALHIFAQTLLARAHAGQQTTACPQARREQLEDAWEDAAVLRRWQSFATTLDAAQASAVLERAAALGLPGQRLQWHPDTADTWAKPTPVTRTRVANEGCARGVTPAASRSAMPAAL